MRAGIGLPNALPGTEGHAVVEWAQRAESAGFSTVASIDRVGYDNYDPFCTLAAGTAERFHRRGAALDRQLDEMARLWRGEGAGPGVPVGPTPFTPGGPPVLVGGSSAATWTRVARAGVGWISGRGDAGTFTADVAEVGAAWTSAGRPGDPRLLALVYFSLGPGGTEAAEAFIRDYYGYAPFVDSLLASVSTSEGVVRETAARYAAAGCQELLLFPCRADPDQVDRLAGALSSTGCFDPG